jgi:hypothetical protein
MPVENSKVVKVTAAVSVVSMADPVDIVDLPGLMREKGLPVTGDMVDSVDRMWLLVDADS